MIPCILSAVVSDLIGTAGVLADIHVSPKGLALTEAA